MLQLDRMKSLAGLLLLLSFFIVQEVQAASTNELKTFDQAGQEIGSFIPFPENAPGSLATADLGQDGVAEIVVGAGPNGQPIVRVFRQDGSKIGEFMAYNENFRGGVNVAVCDLDQDGKSEIITGAGYTGGPHIRVFSNLGVPTGVSFFAYDPNFRGGVNITCGDITNDGIPEIVTGAGITGGPHIRVFNSQGLMLDEAFSGSATDPTGTFVALGDTDGDDIPEVLASPAAYAHPNVTLFDWTNGALKYQQAFVTGTTPTHGSPVTTFDIDNNGSEEIAVSEGAFGSSALELLGSVGNIVSTIETSLPTVSASLIPARLKDEANNHLLILASSPSISANTGDKFILVDLSEQRLTAYSNGIPVNTFLVSTGTAGWPTPLGTTTVTAKIPIMDYTWNYGVGNPNNYSLPDVKWNMRFRNHYYIHSAYWHNNFGQPMSHGCVNTSIPDAEWIYSWADVGTTVEIKN
jgi:lipoprotein-anchoring transpeptidase ErfK/SrfK